MSLSAIPILFLALAQVHLAPVGNAPFLSSPLDLGYRQMYNLQFAEAHRTFEAYERSRPDDPMAPTSRAAAYLFSEFEGLGLSFRQAIALAEALRAGHLRGYQAAHRRIGRMPHRMSRLILLMDRSAWLRERALRAMSAEPQLFARLLSANGSGPASSSLGAADALRLGWRLARS